MLNGAVGSLKTSTSGYIHSGLKPWDVAAAAILIEKAGGTITTPEGGVWNIFNPDIFATNTVLHKELVQLFRNP